MPISPKLRAGVVRQVLELGGLLLRLSIVMQGKHFDPAVIQVVEEDFSEAPRGDGS